MRNLVFSSSFLSGAGTGKNDVKPVSLEVLEVEDSSSARLSPLFVMPEGSGTLNYQAVTELYIMPGYFYLGDREFYAFGEKGTVFARPVIDDGQAVICLPDFPDGALPITDTGDTEEPAVTSPEVNGASPIIVRRYPSGTIEALRVPSGVVISSEVGYSGTVGYTLDNNLSGMVAGEVPDWPWFHNPLSRFGKTFEYWRQDDVASGEILSPDLLTYDFEYNRIILPSGSSIGDYDYIVEMELSNEPFPLGVNFSPLDFYPEDVFVCVGPSGVIDSEEAGAVAVRAGRSRARGEVVTVSAEVFSTDDNRMAKAPVTFWVERPLLRVDGTAVSGIPESYEAVIMDDLLLYDVMELPSGSISENGIIIANDHRIDGKTMIPSAGYLSGVVPAAYVDATTDFNGFATCRLVTAFSVPRPVPITINASCGQASGSVALLVRPSGVTGVYTGPDPLDVYTIDDVDPDSSADYAIVSGAVLSEGHCYCGTDSSATLALVVPSGCVSPTSIEVYGRQAWYENIYLGTTPTPMKPIGIFRYSDHWLIAAFDGVLDDSEFIMKYPIVASVAQVDGRSRYG